MILNQTQIDSISDYVLNEGVTDDLLKEDLIDHLSCKTEEIINSKGLDFETAFEMAKLKCSPNGPQEFERDLKLLTTFKPNTIMRKIAFIGGYASALCFMLAVLFFALSSLQLKKNELRLRSVQMEYGLKQDSQGSPGLRGSLEYQDFERQYHDANATSLSQYIMAERLLIACCILFITTILPYQFYSKYRKGDLELAQV